MPKDPICGMAVDGTSGLRAERDGETFYFCSDHCREAFLAQAAAASSLQHGDAETNSWPAPEKVIYTCPMHPEVRQDKPGSCHKCGMDLVPEPTEVSEEEDDPELRAMTRRFWVSVALGLPVLLLAMLPMIGVPIDRWIGRQLSLWMQFVLATPVVLWAGWPFFQRGWRSLVTWKLNMFTLIAMGTGAAYFYSVIVLLFPGMIPEAFRQHGQAEVYFEAAAVITALVLLGQVLEQRAHRRTGSALRELLSLAPPTARVVDAGQDRDSAPPTSAKGRRAPRGSRRQDPRGRRSHRGPQQRR